MARERWSIQGDGPIAIARDVHGVAHVQARSEVDLYRGLGHCHGVDRALQILLVRVLAQGRASECLEASDETARLDGFFRRLDFTGDAAAEVERMAPEVRALGEAYCDGVNRALARRVPWELRLVGYAPEPWTLADSVALSRVAGYVALAQSQGEMERLLVEMVQAGVPRTHLEALFPGLLDGLDEKLVRAVRLGERVVPNVLPWGNVVPRVVASNNWVVAGRKTASGRPLLANDPHLEVNRLPAVWYEVVLELPARFCIAATMPGLPMALLGRTDDLAWGATYTFMDAIDSWIEDCRDGRYRRTRDGHDTWVPFRTRIEIVKRKRKPDLVVTVHENEHGTLDGDPTQPGLYLATRWSSGSGTGAASLAAGFAVLRARDVAQGMEALGGIETPWNWVLADRHGAIGYQMSGRMPLRRAGRRGLVPLPGWDPENDWRGFVPASALPRAMNPESGFLVTANDDLNHLGEAHPINLPMGAYRAERIADLLAARDDWTVGETARLQMDVYAPQAARYMALLRPLLPPTPEGALLAAWDCRYDLASRGATLFERFYRALAAEVFGAVCGDAVARFVIGETGVLADFYASFDRVLLAADGVWYGREGRDGIFHRVAARVLTPPVEPWGERQQLSMKHLLLGGRLPRWLGFDYGPIAVPGGRATVHQGQIYRSRGRETSFVPSLRLVTDLGEPAVHSALAGGPSDRRFSRWYTAGIDGWLAGRLKRLEPARREEPWTSR